MKTEKFEKAREIFSEIYKYENAIKYLNGLKDPTTEFWLRAACSDNKEKIIEIFKENLITLEFEFENL